MLSAFGPVLSQSVQSMTQLQPGCVHVGPVLSQSVQSMAKLQPGCVHVGCVWSGVVTVSPVHGLATARLCACWVFLVRCLR